MTAHPAHALDEVVMSARGISKVYGGTRALNSVDFDIRAGKVTVLYGENGAGKSTLMRIMSGVESPTAGTLTLDGEEVTFASPAQAEARGVAIIHQELNLSANMTVAESIFLGREIKRFGFVDTKEQVRRTQAVLDLLEEPIDPRATISNLRLGQQQLVEIARALDEDARVLIMDEPTSALSATEVEVLFRVIRDLTDKGVAIVYISHHLDETLEIGDHAVVFRDGELVATAEMRDIDLKWIVSAMVGRSTDDMFTVIDAAVGDTVLEVDGLTVADPTQPGRLAVDDLSLSVRAGEVVGIYGLMGAGRTELFETLIGRNRAQAGSVRLFGRDVTNTSIGDRIARGMYLVPEDRQKDGLVQGQSVGANLSLASVTRFTRLGITDGKAERSRNADVIGSVRVKASSQGAPIGSLSGGNQQKVVVGKALLTEPQLILLDEPTRGVDIGAKADIFKFMAELAGSGVGVLFATSEVAEVLNSTTRILVMSRGRVAAEFTPASATREAVLAAADDSELVELEHQQMETEGAAE
ncbi:sugar ABC transporter ATP-binding protein [Tessaracoccus rhinocerotis]|nr:sugar ABC transporter ATP-binding protein [Tessaracoccus rhinocerotis]